MLRNLAFASPSLCRTYRIDRCQDPDTPLGWSNYLGWLKPIVSEVLLEIAIKIRVIEDFLRQEEFGAVDFTRLAESVAGKLVLARYLPSQEPIPLRECCNKIIHAVEVSLKWISTRDDDGGYEYWNGEVALDGSKGKDQWSCELYVVEFTERIDALLVSLEEKVDWHHVYKYDE